MSSWFVSSSITKKNQQVSQLDQKLLWAELDEEQSGAATWHFIGNAWSRVVALSKAATYFISFPSDTTSATDDTAWRCMNEATFLFNGTRSLSISLSSLLLSWFLVCAGGVSQSPTEADPAAPIDSRARLLWVEMFVLKWIGIWCVSFFGLRRAYTAPRERLLISYPAKKIWLWYLWRLGLDWLQ